jgi:MFS family permease
MRAGERRGAWWALAGCVTTIVLTAGARTSLAAFIRPIESDLGLDRGVLSTAGALTVLSYGLGQPVVGALATRYGPRQVMIGGVLLTALGGFGLATATQAWQLYVFAGLLPGLAFAASSSVPGTVLLARWFVARLGLATGIMSSAIPAGQGIFVPLAAGLIPLVGWRATYIGLGLLVAAVALPALGLLVNDPPSSADQPRLARRRARPGLDVWLVGVGYFACGFTDQFVSMHLVPLASDAGLDPLLAAGLLSFLLVIGIGGSIGSGPLADRVPPKWVLAGLYSTRALSLPLLLLVAPGPRGLLGLIVFGVVFGATYIANQAPGARLVRDRYGVGSVGPLMGGVGLAHQVGGAAGVSLGGLSVADLGSYAPAVVACAVVALIGGLAQTLIPPAGVLPSASSAGDHPPRA